jgi:mono/diheme cytochrome c family protein
MPGRGDVKLAWVGVTIVGLAAGILLSPLHAQQTTAASSGRSVWDGVYTLEQAKRGALKSGLCTQCHGDGFVGGPAPQLAGSEFTTRWDGKTVGDLFELIRLTMPDDDPGALPREQYADLIAYIFAVNKYPVGKTEIGIDLEPLKQIRMEAAKQSRGQ